MAVSGAGLTQAALDAAIAQAEAEGFEVVRATDSCLLLDLDTPEALAQYARVLPILMENCLGYEAERWQSKSGNTHVRVTLNGQHPWAVRYALQAALGSDGVREVLAVLRMMNGCDEASNLFRPKKIAEAA